MLNLALDQTVALLFDEDINYREVLKISSRIENGNSLDKEFNSNISSNDDQEEKQGKVYSEKQFKNEINRSIKRLRRKLPGLECGEKSFKSWWVSEGERWKDEITFEVVRLFSVRTDGVSSLSLDVAQTRLLTSYYRANSLLAECLKRCYVSKSVREDMELRFLIPKSPS